MEGKLYKITVQWWELKRHVICLDTTRSQNDSPHERKQLMRSIALNLMFCSYSEEYFEARADKDLFRMHQWLIKQKNQGLCLYKTHYWRRLGLAVLLLHSRSVLKVSTEVWSYMQSIHPRIDIHTCSLIQNIYCTCTQALLSEVNSQPLFIHACMKHIVYQGTVPMHHL